MSEFNATTAAASHQKVDAIIAEVEKVIVGKRRELELLLSAMLSGGHILLEDVPGVGKTTLAASLAKSAGLSFKRAQFTPDVMASDITGFNMYNRSKEQFEFREGLVMTNIMLADEINRASPKTQSSLLEAMEENAVTVDGVTYKLPKPFFVIATQNPSGYVGTYPLPEAQLDRFSIRMTMGYPTEDEEYAILTARRGENPIDKLSPVTTAEDVAAMTEAAAAVKLDPEITKYIVALVRATRQSDKISLGASPRASLALMKVTQAYAFVHGRDYAVPEDVSAVFLPCIAHRLTLSKEARMNSEKADDILRDILHTVKVPFKATR